MSKKIMVLNVQALLVVIMRVVALTSLVSLFNGVGLYAPWVESTGWPRPFSENIDMIMSIFLSSVILHLAPRLSTYFIRGDVSLGEGRFRANLQWHLILYLTALIELPNIISTLIEVKQAVGLGY